MGGTTRIAGCWHARISGERLPFETGRANLHNLAARIVDSMFSHGLDFAVMSAGAMPSPATRPALETKCDPEQADGGCFDLARVNLSRIPVAAT
jgi:hypothetical protein